MDRLEPFRRRFIVCSAWIITNEVYTAASERLHLGPRGCLTGLPRVSEYFMSPVYSEYLSRRSATRTPSSAQAYRAVAAANFSALLLLSGHLNRTAAEQASAFSHPGRGVIQARAAEYVSFVEEQAIT